MSGVAILASVLAADSTLTATVPAGSITGGIVPQGASLPALLARQISGIPTLTIAMSETVKLYVERIQVTIYAGDYALQKRILGLVRRAATNRHGIVAGSDLDSILPAGEGPDDISPDPKIFEQSLDFIVKYRA